MHLSECTALGLDPGEETAGYSAFLPKVTGERDVKLTLTRPTVRVYGVTPILRRGVPMRVAVNGGSGTV